MKKIIFYLLLIQLLFVSFNTKQDEFKYKKDVRVELDYKIKIGEGTIDKMRLVVLIPNNIKDRQTINKFSFNINPDSLISDNESAYAVFYLHNITKKFILTYKGGITIYKHISTNNSDTTEDLKPYLVAENFIEVYHPNIIRVAKTLKNNHDLETIINTYNYVKENVTYKKGASQGAVDVMESGEGKCTDFSDLFCALLRANKIPAKVVHGLVIGSDYPFHQWAEAYVKKQGWVKFDPTGNHTSINKEDNVYKIKEKNKYVILSFKRSDSTLHTTDGGHYNYQWWGDAQEVKIKMNWATYFK